jgi:Ca2+ transporting ATPase
VKPLPKIRSLLRIIWSQSEDYTLRILFWIAVLTTILGVADSLNSETKESYKWVEGASIFFAVFMIVVISSACDNLKEKQFLKLQEDILGAEIQVIRG